MCKELYERWNGCDCWGFLRADTCRGLFKSCFGPSGEQDKKVTRWNDGMCSECWDRLLREAEEMAEADQLADASATASTSSGSTSTRSYSTHS
ncbi:hypothetical protein JX265_000889 [Neoarthrinium moseri]|uniref:Uncharacterized protein n=1 Tax=Neoarthrinium moseri TaxID=1658444 RepID=A0A9P9WWN7_9PEZI|nr:uncharacterized protein JN550_007005 [Neoarthrinium moseri]KAI1847651.1 hypothetical protein JX266_006503 [Neoarthrinium moseri]KAI1867274.1 hypothetical protein JN550_007005 [Neoarthrinium moseri]KAI1880649.1 hypothetical protein JX265_000889 [Neoarthrinium moseri]